MDKYEIAVVVAGLLTTAIAIGAPVIKLNTTITRLIVKLDGLGEDMAQFEVNNHESHRRIWKHNDEQDYKLADHETRLQVIEKGGMGDA